MKMKLFALAAAVLIAWGLKRHYSAANADDLWWILTPTTQLVGVITRTCFVLQPGEGYFSRDQMFLIEKSCAGINFMIAASGMLTVAFRDRLRSAMPAARVLCGSLLAGYSATLVVNAVRISIAMWLADHATTVSRLGAADVHRLEGVVVYFGGLVLLYELAQRFDRRASLAGHRV